MKHLALLLLLLLPTLGQGRDRNQVRLFRSTHPCPATQHTSGACAGWVVDHIKPLCAGGLDAPGNMQWQPRAQAKQKDKIEIAYCRCMAKAIAPCKLNKGAESHG